MRAASSSSSLLLWPGSARCACRHSMGPLPCTAAWLLKPRNASMARRPVGVVVGGMQLVGQLVHIAQQQAGGSGACAACTQAAAAHRPQAVGQNCNVPWLPWEPPCYLQPPSPFFSSFRRVSSLRMFRGSKGAKGPRPVCAGRGAAGLNSRGQGPGVARQDKQECRHACCIAVQ